MKTKLFIGTMAAASTALVISVGLLMAAEAPSKPKTHDPKDNNAVVSLWVLFYRLQEANANYQSTITDSQKQLMQQMNDLRKQVDQQREKVCPGENVDMSNPSKIQCVKK